MLLLGAAVTGLAWLGGFLYWHVRITRSLRLWEKTVNGTTLDVYWRESGAPPDASKVLDRAGCRALPYIVHALDEPATLRFKSCAVSRIIQCLAGPAPRDPETVRLLTERYDRWDPLTTDSDAERDAKLARVKAWWRENRDRCRHRWRVWSADGLCCLR